ncbi:MAG TPA: phosphate/phosphite/phosphonate ABC transporter substrate-binding protein [Gammaproteobacteria bacterium]|nr:phosphate/phosphite/phosphonate ABC transporter substrate-binding protein [Gammaproteobacteria bacterium]
MRGLLACLILLLGLWGDLAAAEAPLRMGVFPRLPHERMLRMYRPIADWLAERLGRAVTIESAADFPAFWQKVRQGRFDLVHYNQYHYIKAHRQLDHRVILKNEELGRSTIRAIVAVAPSSPVRSIAQLEGRKILFGGGRDALVAYILARDLLAEEGLPPGDYLEGFAFTPVDAIKLVYRGQADAASAGDALLRLDGMPWDRRGDAPRILALSRPVPQLPWAVSAGVDEALEARIRDALLALNHSTKGRHILQLAKLTGLVPASDAEYDPVRRIVARTLGERY